MPRPLDTRLYAHLGVEPDATEEQIKKAYRKLAMKWFAPPHTHTHTHAQTRYTHIRAKAPRK